MGKIYVPLDIAIIETDRTVAEALRGAFGAFENVHTVTAFGEGETALEQILEGKCNALLIDIFSLGTTLGIRLVESTRESAPHIPICLLGTADQLAEMPDVNSYWRQRFAHYYKLAIDQPLVTIAQFAERMAIHLGLYLLSRRASLGLRDIRNRLEQPETRTAADMQREQMAEALELAQEALDARRPAGDTFIVPGFDDQNLQALVKGTIEKASASLDGSALVNKRLLQFGCCLVAAAFVVAVITGSWKVVSFGGMGLAGIITAVITNPLKGIAATARRLVQIQVAYIGFLHVLGTAGNHPADPAPDSFDKRAKSINEAIRNVLGALEKHCQ